MEVCNYIDQGGISWREIRSKSEERLKELKEVHEKTGQKCWLDYLSAGKWMLVVQLTKGE